jgi:hypothetical protein
MSSMDPSRADEKPAWSRRPREGLRQTRRALGLMWTAAPGGTALAVALVVLTGALQPTSAVVGKLVIDSVLTAQRALGGPGAMQSVLRCSNEQSRSFAFSWVVA